MSSIRDILARVAVSGRVTPEDAAGVRAAVYCDALISADDAEALFAINDAARTAAPDEDEAAWLADRIARHGPLDENEIALLRLLAARAPAVPPVLWSLLSKAGIPRS